MTLNELRAIQDILQWCKPLAKTDGLYMRINLARDWIDRDIRLKLMNPTKFEELDNMDKDRMTLDGFEAKGK